MAKIILIPDDYRSKAAFLKDCNLPDFYMEDFSIQAIAVDRYEDAREILFRSGYRLLDKSACTDILIDHTSQIRAINTLFSEYGINAQLTDIADTIYQA